MLGMVLKTCKNVHDLNIYEIECIENKNSSVCQRIYTDWADLVRTDTRDGTIAVY